MLFSRAFAVLRSGSYRGKPQPRNKDGRHWGICSYPDRFPPESPQRCAGLYREYRKGQQSPLHTRPCNVFGNITRLDNALENLAGSLQAEQNSLEETKTQLENARTELAAPFAREEELAEKTARLKELNILLNMDEKDKTLLDDTPDEGEDVPARRVAELAR